ncbi:Sporangia induced parkin coregulated protein [Phytophthora palmivora]|uniref:Sporangia induced parkin coregulated protein n=1 Tax=Phytophthora palmivora TaxID=4796 RepID=A0A2P4XDW0_9STRA|nr:Sporangia induced parkin coregulated protein [Phytophthora palmivora]
MAPIATTKPAVDCGNNSELNKNDSNNCNASSSHSNSRGNSRSSQARASNSREKSRSSTPTTSNQNTELLPKRTTSLSSAKSSRKALATPETENTIRKAVTAYPLPSTTLHKHKQAAVFTSGKKKHRTNFSNAYDAGSIPCRINHGGIRSSLQWTRNPNTIPYDPLLITCVEGFLETELPFVFLSRTTFRELMKLEDAREKVLPILAQVIVPLRTALMAKDDDTFVMALEATRLLSDLVEGEMNVYLPKLTQQIHRKLLTKQLRADVEDTLAVLESNGGKEALSIIRSKIPTYVSIR